MLCDTYQDMTPFERVVFIGKLVHCVQCDELAFAMATRIIADCEEDVLKNVKILPDNGEEESTDPVI